ncbi:MAG TPA: hypothetical protein VLV78_09855 [Thermoanaerobaculia bacterium]|nr:hypothetical protein [Thermoanaerobaculia bacterium]
MAHRRSLLFAVAAVVFALSAAVQARVISYAPYTDRTAYPAHQARTNRHFLLLEAASWSSFSAPPAATYGQLVLYDFEGAEEPKVVFPVETQYAIFTAAAIREADDGTPVIFAQAGNPADNVYKSYLSIDGGKSWKQVADLPTTAIGQLGTTGSDNGGPFASYRYSQIRIGTSDLPFVVATNGAVYSISMTGAARKIFESGAPATALSGRNANGTKFLVRTSSQLVIVDLDGKTSTVLNSFISPQPAFEGFITPDDSVYVDERSSNSAIGKLWFVQNGSRSELFSIRWADTATPSVFAVPAIDYRGAWIIQRGGGQPTVLYRHTPGHEIETMWQDITAPDVEALHAGSSGDKLLIQVHRPRPAVDQRVFRDPALAIWHIGDPAPRVYDELFMNEQWNKGFVHLDVEKIAGGEPFVFDSGAAPMGGGGGVIVSPPTSGGGSDVTQEWGVVRASLKQQLVLPTVGRTKGAFGSDWSSDVIIQNPSDSAQRVVLKFVPDGHSTSATDAKELTLTLGAQEIRMITDIVGSSFGIQSGIGALFITPEEGVTVTSRTYSKAGAGTFGFGMNAIDVLAAAASPRFPVSFSGAFPGTNFRTNVTITDTSGRGTEVTLSASGIDGIMGSDVSISTGANGHQQINFIGASLGLFPYETGALVLRPARGTAVTAAFAIDNRTNDSTYFPPDLPSSSMVRVIPAIGHLDGANNSRFRSDLYLFNPSDQPRVVTLEAKAWDIPESPGFLQLTLLPNEARTIRDVLYTAFGKTGIARLRITSQVPFGGSGVRVTSRTYNVDSNGGTYGFLMAPLNNFQIGGSGDTLEILGAIADPKYRTNIGLVEMNPWPTNQTATAKVEILDASSKTVDSFTVNLPVAGGTQLNDVFRARAINVSGPVLIRVTPTNGVIGAYATTTDNVTNDSSYLAANLAAKE